MELILNDYIIQLGGKRKNSKKLKRSTSFDLQKEANFMKAIEIYIHEHSFDIFFQPLKPESPELIVPAEVKLRNVNAHVEEYLNNIKAVRKMYQNIYDRFKNIIPHTDSLIYRYYIFGYLIGNISLSVSPRIKKEWGITHELFGAFYNVDLNNTYCSLFPDLEPNSVGNVLFFTPKKGDIILANPPYVNEWINWMINKILNEWRGIAAFHIVIPVWDRRTRRRLQMDTKYGSHEIEKLIDQSTEHSVIDKFEFYNGINNKISYLIDPVHYIKI